MESKRVVEFRQHKVQFLADCLEKLGCNVIRFNPINQGFWEKRLAIIYASPLSI